jgi:protein required for attachment to host cells
MASATWILIANASRASLYRQQGRSGPCRTVQEFQHPESSAKGRDLRTDRPGRVQQRMASGRRAGADPRVPPKRLEATHFAHELAAQIIAALRDDSAARLVLVAPPRFLGLLRKQLDTPLQVRVVESHSADLTSVDAADLPERLAELRATL